MNLDRYLQKPLDAEPEEPVRKFVPRKPLADALEAQRKPRPFDQAAADAFAKGVHWPIGHTEEMELPDGITEDSPGDYWAECRSCGRSTSVFCNLIDIPMTGYQHYCFGSARCLP